LRQHGDCFEALYVLAVHCGLREGELLGLKWEDVALDAGTLAVCRTLSETKAWGHVFELPKNGKGRNIKLTAGAVRALRRYRKAQLEEQMRLMGLWEDHGLIFPNQVRPCTPRTSPPATSSRFSSVQVSPTPCACMISGTPAPRYS
jgi:integrase